MFQMNASDDKITAVIKRKFDNLTPEEIRKYHKEVMAAKLEDWTKISQEESR